MKLDCRCKTRFTPHEAAAAWHAHFRQIEAIALVTEGEISESAFPKEPAIKITGCKRVTWRKYVKRHGLNPTIADAWGYRRAFGRRSGGRRKALIERLKAAIRAG